MSVTVVLAAFRDELCRDGSAFGRYVNGFLKGSLPVTAGCSRDILPLPRVDLQVLAPELKFSSERFRVVDDWLGIASAGLNFLYTG